MCTSVMSGQNSSFCASVTWADIFLFCFHLLCPTCHLSCMCCQTKVNPHTCRRSHDAWRISHTLLLLFCLLLVQAAFSLKLCKVFVSARKRHVWTKVFASLWRVCSFAMKYWYLLYTDQNMQELALLLAGGYTFTPSMRECFKVVCSQTAWIINYPEFFAYWKLLVSFRKAGWKIWNGWTLPCSDLYGSVTTVRRLPVSHPAAVKLRTIQHPCRPVRVIPQRSTVKSSAQGLQAQPGWMPHKFTTRSLCYALLYPEGWEKRVALARWVRSLSTYQEKELS